MATNATRSKESQFINQVCRNTKTDFIEITEDKLENILNKFIIDLKDSYGWVTCLTVFLTVLIAMLTTDFKDFANVPKDVWNAIFIIVLVLSFCCFAYKLYKTIVNRKNVELETLINRIKNN